MSDKCNSMSFSSLFGPARLSFTQIADRLLNARALMDVTDVVLSQTISGSYHS